MRALATGGPPGGYGTGYHQPRPDSREMARPGARFAAESAPCKARIAKSAASSYCHRRRGWYAMAGSGYRNSVRDVRDDRGGEPAVPRQDKNQLFRKEALERLDDIDELDRLVTVTHPRAWLALGAVAALIITALVWASAGRLETTVSGQGMLLTGGHTLQVTHPRGRPPDQGAGRHRRPRVRRADRRLVAPAAQPQQPQAAEAVTSPYAGVVGSLQAYPGQYVGAGAPLITVDPSEPLVATLYLPIDDGKKIEVGQSVQIVPANVSVDEYGYLLGKVTFVAGLASTPEGMQAVLQNEFLVREFAAAGPVAARAGRRCSATAATPSGYAWSSSDGPPGPGLDRHLLHGPGRALQGGAHHLRVPGPRPARRRRRMKDGVQRRVRTPTVLQMEAVECGAAALGIILGYHGRYIPLEELRVRCGVSRDGSKAINILKAARDAAASKAKGWQSGRRRAQASVEPPFIALLELQPLPRRRGLRARAACTSTTPPAARAGSPRRSSTRPTPASSCASSPGRSSSAAASRRAWSPRCARASPARAPALVFVILAGLVLIVPGLVSPVFTQIFVDDYLVGRRREWVVPLLAGMLRTAALIGVPHLAAADVPAAPGDQALASTTSSRFLWHVLRLPVQFFAQRYAGEIGSRVALNDKVAALLSGQLATTVIDHHDPRLLRWS